MLVAWYSYASSMPIASIQTFLFLGMLFEFYTGLSKRAHISDVFNFAISKEPLS